MLKKIKHFKRQKVNVDGFSLIELVIAVGILAILSLVGVVAYSKITENARQAAVEAAAAEVLTGAVAYDANGDDPEAYKQAEKEWMETRNGDTVEVLSEKNGDCIVVRAWNNEHEHIGTKKQSGTNCVGSDDSNNDNNNPDNGEDDNYFEDIEYGVVKESNYGSLFFDIQGKNVPVNYTINIVRLDNNETVFTHNGRDSSEDYSYEYFTFDMASAEGVEKIRVSGTVDGKPYSFVREVSNYSNPEIDYGTIIISFFDINGKEFFGIIDGATGDPIINDEDPDGVIPGGGTGDENIEEYKLVDLQFGAGIQLSSEFIQDKLDMEFSYIIYDEFGDVVSRETGVIEQGHIDDYIYEYPVHRGTNLFLEVMRPVDDDGSVILPEYTIVFKVGDKTDTVYVKDYYTLDSDGKYSAGKFIHNGSTVENVRFGV